MMLPLTAAAHVRIDHYSAVHLAAAAARSLSEQCGLPGALPDQAAVLASELASNIDKHARDGALYIQPLPLGRGVEILAADRGPGMPELERCLADGYTTVGTLGAGLGAVSRIASDFTIRTQVGVGTLACARLTRPDQPAVARQSAALVCLPADREEHCGDAGAVIDDGTIRTAVVVDGLGHGIEAAEAAQAALRSFRAASARPLPDILTALHRTLRHTRGAAVAVLRLDGERAVYCGIGNIRAVALSHEGVHHRLTGQPGVVGWRMPTPKTHAIPLPAGTTGVLHTDGIDARWTHAPSLFALRLPPQLLTASVTHNYRSTRDDATVLAVKPHPRLP
ncbi:Serine/threonine-protein kinase RsbT [Streptomyces hundungensis]|uniref:Serine/threonine-protein kinase RsbT n=1 Tax=Streptomyces hundungensis TaxID=1077946 RepID=A0A387H3I2_9ACTN|nr:SpoIIE family protein phosphatase [Streptomyces hundungensis]AYG78245.1 Serine/threonine-protein kinase RsbT [Streptomyces hundungensis]